MTWNDFCWNDWNGVSCWNTFVVLTVVIVILIAIIVKVILWLTGRPWPWWLSFAPEEMPAGLPVWRVILLLVAIFLIFLIGDILQPEGMHR